METLVLTLLGVLAALFAASAFAKVTYWHETLEWFSELLPRLPPHRVARAVIAVEVLIAVAAVVTPRAGAAAATVWLVTASAVLWHGRRQVADCGCFGLRRRLGKGVAVRNGLAILAAVAATAGAGPGVVVPFELLAVAAVTGATAVAFREAIQRKGVVV